MLLKTIFKILSLIQEFIVIENEEFQAGNYNGLFLYNHPCLKAGKAIAEYKTTFCPEVSKNIYSKETRLFLWRGVMILMYP